MGIESHREGALISDHEHARSEGEIRAVRVHRFGENPLIDEVPAPVGPRRGELLVDVLAAGVGAWDVGVAEGRLTNLIPNRDRPFTMGAELCGRVREFGLGVEGFAVGDRVMANPGVVGAWADRVCLQASDCGRAPLTVDDAGAATIPVRGLAAWQALELLDLPSESALLVIGAGGAVGRAAVEIARGRGLRVFAIAGGEALESLQQLGAELAVDYRSKWKARLTDVASRGVEGALDLVGGDSLVHALDLVRDDGRIASTVTRALPSDRTRGLAFEFLKMKSRPGALDAIADLVDRGGLTTRIERSFALEEAAAALDLMRSPDRKPGEVALLT